MPGPGKSTFPGFVPMVFQWFCWVTATPRLREASSIRYAQEVERYMSQHMWRRHWKRWFWAPSRFDRVTFFWGLFFELEIGREMNDIQGLRPLATWLSSRQVPRSSSASLPKLAAGPAASAPHRLSAARGIRLSSDNY